MNLLSEIRANQFRDAPSLNTLFQYISVLIWERIGHCRSNPALRYSENTITEEIVRLFDLMNYGGRIRIMIMTATHEKANGNEIEININTRSFSICLPIQAKLLYPSMKYEKIGYYSGNKYQIDLLLVYARQVNGVPLYFLYNFSNNEEENISIQKNWKVPIQHFGVSFTSAYYVHSRFYPRPEKGRNSWRIPTFTDLVGGNVAFPLECISQFSRRDFLPAFFQQTAVYYNFIDESIERYFLPPPRPGKISGIEISDLDKRDIVIEREEPEQFRPKYVIDIFFR